MKSSVYVMSPLVLAASLLACNPLAPDQSVSLPVTAVDAPTTVAANATFPVTLTVRTGGCTTFVRIEIQPDVSGAKLVAWGRDSRIGRGDVACPQDVRSESHAVELKAGTSDPFFIGIDNGTLALMQVRVRVQ
jgi:hypothetical protein